MIEDLSRIETVILTSFGATIQNFEKDKECNDYFGYNFQIDGKEVKYRKARITPKKVGQFVTLWKRNSDGQTAPYELTDKPEFYLVAAAKDEQFGFFIFPKKVLADKQILSAETRSGKRGFRIYPDWDVPQNQQAEKAQKWQIEFFINLTGSNMGDLQKFGAIFGR